MAVMSVVLPAYNEEETLLEMAEVLKSLLSEHSIEYELVFVDDGSKDRTWDRIIEAHEKDPLVKGIHFSRNFGKESAIFAGLARACGDCVAVMDCDLQHPPKKLIEMYRLWQEGYEVVEGKKDSRGKENVFYGAAAGLFYKLMTWATRMDMERTSDFKLLDRKVVDALLSMPEKNAFFRAMSSWVGFRSVTVSFDVEKRSAGKSKWSRRALVGYAISNIVGYSALPMQFVTGAGSFVMIFALILGIQTLMRYFKGAAVEGFTTVILLILFIGSILMISIGIIGFYIARIYEEVKGRPKYFISEEIR